MAKKGVSSETAVRLILDASDQSPEIVKLMAFFTIYRPSEIEELQEDDFLALAGYCADRIIKANPGLEDVEISQKEILTKIRAELNQCSIQIQKLPLELSLGKIAEMVFVKNIITRDIFNRVVDGVIKEYCKMLQIPRFITVNDQI
ncbi:MAG TPA: hypothetical protein P5080_04880 [Candidatus Paceibacterota bacterium]|nr:hypothetical protein [Candidatus Pacearchaeota archaeon]HRZ51286.1 hypothetical protein [Candidatus Paceibacterota bacterium]HSA37008.1 hypothetical protein [Candidatus Paceibacterota bacterium]